MAVIWNPAIRKSVGIVFPKALYKLQEVVGFGVCPRTSDPKLVKISVVKEPSSMWVVEVFTLSRRVWETVYMDAPFKSCDLVWIQVSIDGVIYWCAYDDEDLDDGLRKSVGIVIPKALYKLQVVGFGVCPRTSDPKLVKISVVKEPSSMWVVEVFTLSRRVWETVYMDAPFKSCDLVWIQVSIDGVIYGRAYDDEDLDDGLRSNFIISFDLKSYKFGEVCLPERLVYTQFLLLANMNESLVLLEYNDEENGLSVCSMWMRKDGENKPFTKIYTVKVEDRSVYHNVLGFRKNGEAVLEVRGCINNVGIVGKHATFFVRSYMETLLLLDEPNTIIHS
nr:hypothetical protein [Tanacetum cinerariifolium]